jgi:large subunit ribosomal protein L19
MNKQAILQYIDNKYQKGHPIEFRVGDTVRVHVKIIEGTSHRIQVFEGTVISFKGHGGARTFTVRKISFNVGVERTFPVNAPTIEKVIVVRHGEARRSKLYYLRDRMGRASRLEEKDALLGGETKTSVSAPAAAPVATPQELVASEEK